MKHDECFQLGTITRKVGLNGGLEIFIDADNPRRYEALDSVFLDINGKLVPFFIKSLRFSSRPGHAILHFEDIKTQDEIADFIGLHLYLPLNTLPVLTGKDFYFHEIVGYNFFEQKTMQPLGLIHEIRAEGPNPICIVKNDDQDILIPLVREWIVELDRKNKRLVMNLPDGLLTLNRKITE